jgi:hypothetical protein
MTYPHVKLFDTLALEGEGRARLARERRAARPAKRQFHPFHGLYAALFVNRP